MSVDAALLAEARAMVTAMPDHAALDLTPLTSLPEVLAFVATAARSDGSDEGDLVELTIRLGGLTPAEARDAERTLRRLGYTLVADRLKQIAGRRRSGLVPVPAE